MVPSTDLWRREDFLRARRAQMEAQIARDLRDGIKAEYWPHDIERVTCDDCGADIRDHFIRLVHFGRRAVCGACYLNTYATDPITHRPLMPDGTLGPVTQHTQGEDNG